MNSLEIRSLTGLLSLYSLRMLGLFMVLPVLSVYGDDYAGSTPFLLGMALGIYGLTQGLFQIPLGLLSDRVGRKAVIAGGMLVFLAGSLVAATSDTIYGLVLGRALQGAGAVASAIMALLSDLTTEQNRTKAMAAVGASIGVSFALAMVLGPVLAASVGVEGIFWLTAVLAVFGLAVVIWLVPSPVAASRVASRETLAVPKLIASTLRNGELLRLDVGIFVLHMVQMASWVAVPVILVQAMDFGIASHWWFYLLTMGGGFVAMLPAMIYAERRRRLKPVFIGAIGLLAAAELLLFASGDSFAAFGVGLFLFFTAFNLLEATLPSMVSKGAPGAARGTAMGIYSSSQFFGAFAGGVVGGALAHYSGLEMVFAFSALAAAVWIAIAWTMPLPRHWASLVVELQEGDGDLGGMNLVGTVAGVEDVVVIPDQQLAYLKVDKALFDEAAFEALLGRSRILRG